jgi:SAM-dependent methyltransferase
LVGLNEYAASFANYVLEHVLDLHKAAREIHRVLRSSGIFVASLPNTNAPEFLLARRTPLWFQKMVRRTDAWETVYSNNNIPELIEIFNVNGLIVQDAKYWSYTEGYIRRYPLVSAFSRLFDRFVSPSHIKQLMGNVWITFKKPK